MSVLLMSSDKPGCSALVCGSTTPPAKCSSCVGSEDCGKTLESRGLRQPSANLVPQFLFSGSGFGRKRHYRRPSKGLAEGVHRLPQLVTRQPIALARHDYMRPSSGRPAFQQLAIAFLGCN